jgi:hypothetical protein
MSGGYVTECSAGGKSENILGAQSNANKLGCNLTDRNILDNSLQAVIYLALVANI